MSKQQKKDMMHALADIGQYTLLEVAASYGAEYFKEEASSLIGELAIDTGASFIPGVSGVWQSYKRRRFEKNMNVAMEGGHGTYNSNRREFTKEILGTIT